MATEVNGIDGLKALEGTHLGYSGWTEITQEQVNTFADATGDHQWIHVDVEKAKAGPFGGPIAHGYLTLSLSPKLFPEIMSVSGITGAINYGCDKVRFLTPVPVGARVRLGAELTRVEDIPGGARVYMKFTTEIEGKDKPACISEVIFQYFG